MVQLAARFAESFAATVEGASVRASLPTLRRSVGLCPRCAQPYIGVADACPNCLKGAAQRARHAAVERRDRPTGITAPARSDIGLKAPIGCDESKLPGTSSLPQLDAGEDVG